MIGDWPEGLILQGASIHMSPTATQGMVTDYLDRASRLYTDLDIIIVKDVPYRGMVALLRDERIRRFWFTSECHARRSRSVNAILISRQRSGLASSGMTRVDPKLIGQPWRISYRGYANGALCCDMFTEEGERARLINAQVDSLLNGMHCRQQHELPIITRCLHDAAPAVWPFSTPTLLPG